MRFRTQAVFGVACVVFVSMAGCAIPRHGGVDSELSSVGQDAATSQTTSGQYGLSVSPYKTERSGPGSGKGDEFAFSHPRVDTFVARFQTDLRNFFSGALSRSGRYVPRMSSILEKEGVPQELVYLPLIESGFRTHAVSRAGAVGPWQLIPGTGRRYGLRIDQYVDERRDPVKSTQAAARYLKDLHDMFGDWHLSLAAYNTGEGNIVRILNRGRADDFWEMSDRGYLYQETENFVPEFLAALQIAEKPEAYGFDSPSEEPMHYDLVRVNRPLALTTVARLSGASADTIRELNPALHRGVIPPTGYAVRLPKGAKDDFQVALANLPRNADVRRTPTGRKGKHARVKARRGGSHRAQHGKQHRIGTAGKSPHKGTARVVAAGNRPTKTSPTRRGTQVAYKHRDHSDAVD